jgi:hypothetical protein
MDIAVRNAARTQPGGNEELHAWWLVVTTGFALSTIAPRKFKTPFIGCLCVFMLSQLIIKLHVGDLNFPLVILGLKEFIQALKSISSAVGVPVPVELWQKDWPKDAVRYLASPLIAWWPFALFAFGLQIAYKLETRNFIVTEGQQPYRWEMLWPDRIAFFFLAGLIVTAALVLRFD